MDRLAGAAAERAVARGRASDRAMRKGANVTGNAGRSTGCPDQRGAGFSLAGGRAGGSIEPPKTGGGGGFGKRAQLTGP